jgi:hypothetical protein
MENTFEIVVFLPTSYSLTEKSQFIILKLFYFKPLVISDSYCGFSKDLVFGDYGRLMFRNPKSEF